MNELATLFAVGMTVITAAVVSVLCRSITGRWPWEKL